MPKPAQEIPDLNRLPLGEARPDALDWAGGAFSLFWLLAVGIYVWSGLSGAGFIGILMTLLVVILPLGLCWFAVGSLRAIRSLRAEAARLQAAADQIRVSYASTQQQIAAARTTPRAEEPAERQGSAGAFASRRNGTLTQASSDRRSVMAAPRPTAPGEDQPGLALGTPLEAEAAPLTMADFLRALHFPESPDDTEGFRALRMALADRTTAKLIRAAQDVLTLLAQEGIYMDDLAPDRARPELWRQFAAGERGRTIAGLGGVRDRSCLALTAARMREDTVFRDAAHHFLRSFDKALAAIEPRASDGELSTLSDTRTARAFMLFGRVTGTFD